MKHIVVDFEMNPISKINRQKDQLCRTEIIQIGAVVLDENMNEIGHFMTLVKPQLNDKIERHYEKLTGIKTEMVSHAPEFEDAVGMFLSWCNSISGKKEILQWSESDYSQLSSEMDLKEYIMTDAEAALMTTWYDFQKEYSEVLGVERAVSLSKAVMYAGIEFDGQEHDALWDARNTAKLFSIVRTPDKCEKALASVIDAFKTKDCSTSLGAMFDFTALGFTA